MENISPRKPHWLTNEAWADLLRKYDGVPRCAQTSGIEDLSVDHIIPRYKGGTDEISNLQFLTRRLNAVKGVRPDAYWANAHYFDQTPDMTRARGAQIESFNALISREDYFSAPITDNARLLYLMCWVVGAGKTLGILTTTCALNALIRARWGAARRADRILVVVKDSAIRDQLARDLATDSIGYGLFTRPPRVAVITNGRQFSDRIWLDSHDVVVTCLQQIWDDRRADAAQLLHMFPVIHYDEPHFAASQVNQLVEMASTSLCVGWTSTPVDGAGDLLRRMVRVHVYGYHDADTLDRSMKHLDADVDKFVRVLKITEAELTVRGRSRVVNDTNDQGYDKNIEPAKSVVRAVIEEMDLHDALRLDQARIAVHRREISTDLIIKYHCHGMVACPNVAFAQMLCADVNRLFEGNRIKWPASQGWRAEVVHTDAVERDEDGKKIRRGNKPLTPDHPWLRYKATREMDENCARLLFVVGIAREGTNNPYCLPIGVVSASGSMVEAIQRWLGRQIRAIVTMRNGVLEVPPQALDTVCVITHEVFDIVPLLQRATDFVLDMHDRLGDLRTIDDLDQPRGAGGPERAATGLSIKEKIDIAAILGGGAADVPEFQGNGDDIPKEDEDWPVGGVGGIDAPPRPGDVDNIVEVFGGGDGGEDRRDKVNEWIETVRDDPAKARKQLRIYNDIVAVPIVMREEIASEPSDDDLNAFLRAYHPDLIGADFTVPMMRQVCIKLLNEHIKYFRLPPLVSLRTIDQIRKQIGFDIKERLGNHLKGGNIWELTSIAVKRILGVPPAESAANNSKWDIPQCHAILLRPDGQDVIRGWVISRLIAEGHCPSLEVLHRVPV